MNPKPLRLSRYLEKNYPGGQYYSVYESGFCGFWIHRQLINLGIHNRVVNAADVPTTHKEKDQKRDKMDSRKLARELENQSLKSIYIPTEQQQAFRSICRLYYQISKDRIRIKNRIKSFLHFNGIEIPADDELSHWSGNFIQWLKEIEFEHKENTYHFNHLIDQLEIKRKQTREVLKYMRTCSKDHKIISLLRGINGIGLITAFSLYAELMDIKRFKKLDQLASFVGLIPSVSGSGDKEKDHGLSKRHSKYLRNRLIESAWVAARTDPALTLSYSNYLKRMQKKNAIIRIAKKLINRIRYVWLNEKQYVTSVIQ
jgi:transposase